MRGLPFAPLRGFVRGFIDLVFEANGRFYLLDWKSNFCGPEYADYGAESLADEMAHGHYHLQAHLYALALDSLLRVRVPDYDYERHFGGAIYVFVRGVNGDIGADGVAHGVFFGRPPRARIDALAALCRVPAAVQEASSRERNSREGSPDEANPANDGPAGPNSTGPSPRSRR